MVGRYCKKRARGGAVANEDSKRAPNSCFRGCRRSSLSIPRFLRAIVLVGTGTANWKESCAFFTVATRRKVYCHGGARPFFLDPSAVSSEMENEAARFQTIGEIGGSSLVPLQHGDSPSLVAPWLARFKDATPDQIHEEIRWLEFSLVEEHGFSAQDAADVVTAIFLCGGHGGGKEQLCKILGSISFCKLLLRLEKDEVATDQTTRKTSSAIELSSELPRNQMRLPMKNNLVSKDILLASILHYSDCVTARWEGMDEEMQRAASKDAFGSDGAWPDIAWLPYATKFLLVEMGEEAALVPRTYGATEFDNVAAHEEVLSFKSISNIVELNVPGPSRQRGNASTNTNTRSDDVFNVFTFDSLLLAQRAARLERTEALSNVLLRGSGSLTKEEYEAVRNLLVSLSDDWRALAIRCATSLYRLEAGLHTMSMGTGEPINHRTQEMMVTAKVSLQVYANLSKRLGLHRLQTQLEASAFRVLYPRQYGAASALYHEHGAGMMAISSWLRNKLEKILRDDLSLMYELDSVQVISRVKEPYSFWKKLLRKRIASPAVNARSRSPMRSRRVLFQQPKELSILDINDGVALRVILKARKLNDKESDETTRARETMLCYYVQDLVRSHWQVTNESRLKDYIRHPKANGYQSLHLTSKIKRNNQEFVFEVQIRSEEMHRLAEFGVAAHWTYKSDSTSSLVVKSPSSMESTDICGKTHRQCLSPEPGLDEVACSFLSSVQNVVAVDDRESPYVNALLKARQSLMQSQVYVYVFLAGPLSALHKGQLLSVSAGSRMIDVIETLWSKEDFTYEKEEIQLWKNGKLAHLEENVRNGDMVLVQPLFPNGRMLAGRRLMEKESSLAS